MPILGSSGAEAPEREGEGQGQGLGALAHQVAERASSLFRLELELAKIELAAKAKKMALGVGMLATAGLLGFFAFPMLLTTILLAVAASTVWWLTSLIITACLLLGAGLLALLGIGALKKGKPLPEQALKEAQVTQEALKR